MFTAYGLFTHEAGEYTQEERACYAYLAFNAKATCHRGVMHVLQNLLEWFVIDSKPAKTLLRTWENNPSILKSHKLTHP